MIEYDLILKNAKVIDGTGSPWYLADVCIKNGNIDFIGKVTSKNVAKRVIDLEGKVLAPGFIDVHTHYDFSLFEDGAMTSALKQGVTTQIIGQCGLSLAPIKAERIELLEVYSGHISGGIKPKWNWRTFSDYLKILEEQKIGTNIGAFVGHGTIRINVMGFDSRKPKRDELKEMKKLLKEAMSAGAFGMSVGLIYAPGVYSDTEELIELAKQMKSFGGILSAHMRSETDNVVQSVGEIIKIAKEAGIPCHISHHKAGGKKNWGLVRNTLRLVDEARQQGIDITLDQYPYTAANTTLRAILPPWAQEGGVDKVIERLSQLPLRKRIIDEIKNSSDWENYYQHAGGAEGVLLLYTPNTPQYEGKTLKEISEDENKDPLEIALDIIRDNKGLDNTCYFIINEEDIKTVIQHPCVMIGSDSVTAAPGIKTHPRLRGTFPRVLGKYVREEKTLRLEEAIWKMTGLPAARLNLPARGLIKTGMNADLVVLDTDKIRDGADFSQPFKDPYGIEYVMVNGVIVVENGTYNGIKLGKVLKRQQLISN